MKKNFFLTNSRKQSFLSILYEKTDIARLVWLKKSNLVSQPNYTALVLYTSLKPKFWEGEYEFLSARQNPRGL